MQAREWLFFRPMLKRLNNTVDASAGGITG